MSGEAESSPGRNIPTPEQCFYASFKIYLSDSRTNSICELEESGEKPSCILYIVLNFYFPPDSGQSEVVRIEKTLEVLDVSFGEEEKTLSISPVSKDRDDDTDVEEEDIEIKQFCDKPRLIITDSDRLFKSENYYFDLFSCSDWNYFQDLCPSQMKPNTPQPSPIETRDVRRKLETDDMRPLR